MTSIERILQESHEEIALKCAKNEFPTDTREVFDCRVQVQSAIFGLSGFRPSQGALSSRGMARVVGRYDSAAWLVRDPSLHVKIADAFKLPGAVFFTEISFRAEGGTSKRMLVGWKNGCHHPTPSLFPLRFSPAWRGWCSEKYSGEDFVYWAALVMGY